MTFVPTWCTICNPLARSLLTETVMHPLPALWVRALRPTTSRSVSHYPHQSKHPLSCSTDDSLITSICSAPLQSRLMDLSGIPLLFRMLLGILSGENGAACALPGIHRPMLPRLLVPGVMSLSRLSHILFSHGLDVNCVLSSATGLVGHDRMGRAWGGVSTA